MVPTFTGIPMQNNQLQMPVLPMYDGQNIMLMQMQVQQGQNPVYQMVPRLPENMEVNTDPRVVLQGLPSLPVLPSMSFVIQQQNEEESE